MDNSSILAWEIPWTEDPGGLLSLELQRVKHNWAHTHTHTHTHTHHTYPHSSRLPWLITHSRGWNRIEIWQHTACMLPLLAWQQCLRSLLAWNWIMFLAGWCQSMEGQVKDPRSTKCGSLRTKRWKMGNWIGSKRSPSRFQAAWWCRHYRRASSAPEVYQESIKC